LGKYLVDYKTMELEFRETYGRKVVLRGMANDSPRIVLTKWIKGIFRHGDVVYAAECLITS
jgi:hypothetical protein